MIGRLSIAFHIIGMMIVLVLAITFVFYFAEIKTLQEALWTKETSKAEDIYFIVESLIEREQQSLTKLAAALERYEDLRAGLEHFFVFDGDVTRLKNAMDHVFKEIGVDVFNITDRRRQIIYSAHGPHKQGDMVDMPDVEGLLDDRRAVTILRVNDKWALAAIAPLNTGRHLGAIVVGTWLDDNYARKIAFDTEGHVSFGSRDGLIASSLPFDQRNDIVYETLQASIDDVKSIRIELPGKLKVMYYSPLEVAEKLFSVVVEIDTGSSQELMQEYKKRVLKFSLIILIVAISLGAAFTIYLVKPIKRLQRKARQTVRSISGVDLQEVKGNEIRNMVRLFDALVATTTDHIAERMDAEEELKKHQERLEDQIAERTSELRKTNRKLRMTVDELERQTYQASLLNQIGDLLQACGTEQETYTLVAKFCKKLFPSDSGYISIYDKARKVLKTVSSWGDAVPAENEFRPNECWAIRMGDLHVVETPVMDPLCPHLKDYDSDRYLCAPMVSHGELLGMIHLRFGPDDPTHTKEKQAETFKSKRLLVTSLLEHYAPPLTNLRLRETLKIQSIHDPLTGLFNRRHMTEALEFEARRTKRHHTSLGIIMVDVDHFKNFNDTYSHEAGDVVLCELAAFLRNSIRQEDIACRYGGEEFVLILPETTAAHAQQRAEMLRLKIEKELTIHHQGRIYSIAVSMGIAAFPEHGATIEATLKAADAALYRAKTEGRNRVAIAPDNAREETAPA